MALPTNPVGLYWVWWNPFQRLSLFPTTYNVIFLFHAYPAAGEPTGGTTGAVVHRKPSGTIGSFLNADIATCRARGQRIVLSCGGAGGQIYIQTKARADAFIASIKAINVDLGGSGTTAAFDGIDWNNFEGVGLAGQSTWMTYAGQQLKAFYGTDFLMTSPPAAFEYTVAGQAGKDRALLAEMYAGNALDWMCPQFYDPSDLNTLANVRTALDFYNSTITVNGAAVAIPRNRIGIGFGITSGAGTTSRWSTTNAASAYDTVVADGRTPKGGFNWSNEEDTGNLFATNVANHFTNNVASAANPAFQLALSSQFANAAATTARLIPPTGKTTSSFQAGLMSESSNPMGSLDLASGKYTELEWCIKASVDSVDAAQYEFRVTYGGNALDTYTVTPKWTVGTPAQPPDTTAPTTPTALGATAISVSQINLSWTASTDAVGVTGYKIYRDGTQIATSATTTYQSTGLTASTNYVYVVSAYDAAGNTSAQSSSANATTSAPAGDTTPPSVTITAPADGGSVSGSAVSITASASDNVGVVGVTFKLDGVALAAEDTSAPYAITWDSTTAINGTHTLTAVARDAAGNTSPDVNIVVTVNGGTPPPAAKKLTSFASIRGVQTLII